jgi:decaprenyl-phosphate phosphoribosyltransferase
VAVFIRACRPRQWTKNLLVLAAPCAAGVIDRPLVAARVIGAFAAMCLLSSATYLLNDVRDRHQDRLHPKKRERPIASGEISVGTALAAAVGLAVGGLALASAIDVKLGAVGFAYLGITVGYSLWLRQVIIADVVTIASGFVLRALAGGVATDVYLSRWFVVVTGCSAIFLVTAKRYAELREHSPAAATRNTLRRYSARGLQLTLVAAASMSSVAYCGWAFTRPAHVWWYAVSIVPLVGWLGRYAVLVQAGAGQAPEDLVLRDRMLLVLSLAWTLLFLAGVYVSQ